MEHLSDTSEGECLSDNLEGMEPTSFYNPNHTMYRYNKNAKVGDTLHCAQCGKAFIKKQYSQAFCPGIRTRKGVKYPCRDAYHNSQPEGIERTLRYV